MRLPQLTIDRLTDLKGLMDNFPKEAILDMERWAPYPHPYCGIACCAAGNAVMYVKSWKDELTFDGDTIIFKNEDFKGFNTSNVICLFLKGLSNCELKNIFYKPDTMQEVSNAIAEVLEL